MPSSGTWNDIGLILESRDAPIEAEAAFRRAIALDPEDPIAYGNLAILLLDQSRVDGGRRADRQGARRSIRPIRPP